MNILPTVFEKNASKDYAYDLYSLLLSKRIVFLSDEINDINANMIVAQLLYLDSLNSNDIFLYINSPGGSVTSGLSIYDTINYIESNVITIGIGLCASMGAFLLSSGNKRLALPNCEIMIHEPLGGASGPATNIKIQTERLLKIKNKLNKILAKNTKKSVKDIEKDTNKDYYMNAYEAKKYGLIDDIIKNKD